MDKTLRKGIWWTVVSLSTIFAFIAPTSAIGADATQIPINQYGIRSSNPYVVNRFVKNGKTIDEIIVPSRPNPPKGFSSQIAAVPEPHPAAGTNTIANVPAMTWCFGCSATSAAMMFGHYDNVGYSNMYAGPVNGGVFPMTNATWGTVVINGETRALCPLSATRLGLDGRATKGHVDDYWIRYENSDADPFIGNWTEHTYGECTGDYMGTNQSSLSNTDGSTRFYYYTDGSPLYNYTGCEPGRRDGCHGMRDFVESRGYTVSTNFSQYIYGYNGNATGFTFDNFKTEIDNGRPVLIQVQGHTMLGYGYNDTGQTIYIHDTWDYSDHSMSWGGYYGGMLHYGVGVIRLDPAPDSCPDCPADGIITNATYVSGTTCSCTNAISITLGSNVTVENGATVTFTAPTITVQPGFRAHTGAVVNMQQ
ncbi:MAG: C39 family peptidase [Deltaproteobacteria bacterium]|nr:C39 family peptidase [Deltaproteobacteria bacterium]